MNNLAVLMTCFNRKENTVRCIKRLYEITTNVDIYLVDDNSTDGTYESVQKIFPNVNLLKGTGDLYWSRGMRFAWENARKKNYQFYLWLNDDVVLYHNCLAEIFECSSIKEHKAIIAGIIEDEHKNEILYGGKCANKELLNPDGNINPIVYLNGNFVLIPDIVFQALGNIDHKFHHDLGDADYGLSAIRNKIGVFTTRCAVGYGFKNPICRVRKNGTGIKQRFKKLYSPLGSPPFINFYYRRKHFGIINATVYYIFLHFLNVIPDSLNRLLFGSKYQ